MKDADFSLVILEATLFATMPAWDSDPQL